MTLMIKILNIINSIVCLFTISKYLHLYQLKDYNNIRYLNEYNHQHDLLNEVSLNCSKLGICKQGSFFIENIEEKILPTEEIALTISI